MSFLHSCSFVLTLDAGMSARSALRVLRSLGPMFAPCKLSYVIGTDDITRLTATSSDSEGLWLGEAVTGDAMTTYTPSSWNEILSSFERATSSRDETAIWVNTIGPLLHRAPGTESPRWYGRWNPSDGGLYELFQLRISTVPNEPREVEVVFPLMGYPLTTSLLERERVVDGDPRAATHNREVMLPMIAGIRNVLELPADRASWSIDGEFRTDYPAEFASIKAEMLRLAGA